MVRAGRTRLRQSHGTRIANATSTKHGWVQPIDLEGPHPTVPCVREVMGSLILGLLCMAKAADGH